MLEGGLILSRFLHYVALLTLFGVSLFPLYTFRGRSEPLQLARWRWALLLTGAIVALLTGTLWLTFTVANMTGILAAMIDQNALWSVLHDTDFGHTWLAHLAMSAAILGLIKARGSPSGNEHRDNYTPLLSGLLLASLAGVGHTQQNEGIEEFIHVGADAAHLLAAGAWLGGLLVFLYILLPGHSLAADQDLKEILLRFSGMGYVAVAGLIASGVINSWFLVGSFAALVETFYGQLLLVKLSLFVGMVFLAAANRFWLVPTLKRENDQQRVSLITLRRHVLGEETLGLLVVSIVSVLGTTEPGASQMSP